MSDRPYDDYGPRIATTKVFDESRVSHVPLRLLNEAKAEADTLREQLGELTLQLGALAAERNKLAKENEELTAMAHEALERADKTMTLLETFRESVVEAVERDDTSLRRLMDVAKSAHAAGSMMEDLKNGRL